MLSKNLVFASYFNTNKDPQRDIYWENDYTPLLPLIESVTSNHIEIVIFHDCFVEVPDIELCTWVYVEPSVEYVPSILRWFVYLDYLYKIEYDNVFMVDSTDVILLKNPFEYIEQNLLYIGDEYNNTWNHPYLKNKEKYISINDYLSIKNQYIDEVLLNAGICGGNIKLIIPFLEQLTQYHTIISKDIIKISLDMPIFNYTLRKHYNSILYTGSTVNTRFKEFETNDISWWKHK